MTTDQTRQTVLTVTVTTRPDGGHYFDQADFTGHVTEWVRAALKGQHAVDDVTIAVSSVPPPADRGAVRAEAFRDAAGWAYLNVHAAAAEGVRRWLLALADDELRRMAAEEQPAEHVCRPDARRYYCPTSGQTESDCHGGFTTCCDRPDLHQDVPPAVGEQPETQETVLPCNWARTRTEHTPHGWEPQPGMDPVHCPGYSKAPE